MTTFSNARCRQAGNVEKSEAYFANALDYYNRSLAKKAEVFARKDQMELTYEFKERLDKITAGGKNESPYFRDSQ